MNMSAFDLVKFRLGAATDPTNQERLPFYQEVAKLILGGGNAQYVGTSKRYHSISADNAMKRPASLYPPLDKALQTVSDSCGVAILDLSETTGAVTTLAILRGKIFRHISAAIVSALNDERWNPDRILVLLIPEMLSEQDDARRALEGFIASRRLILIADDCTSTDPDFPVGAYQKALEIVSPDSPLEEFRSRLITRLGWFRAEGKRDTYFRHYFDGSRAETQLGAVLHEYIGASAHLDRPAYVVGCLSMSRWMHTPLHGACIKARIPFDTYEKALDPENPNRAKAENATVTMVVPMVRGGGTVSRLARHLEQTLRPAKLQILSVLIEKSKAKPRGCHRIEYDDGTVQDIHYLLPVSQDVLSGKDIAEWTAVSDPEEPFSSNLSTREFWDLVRTCGVKPEDNVPIRRSAYPMVPDLPAILDRYGAWLTDKLWYKVRSWTKTLRQDIVLICPAGEEGSSKLASCLTASIQANVIQVPREAIETVIKYNDGESVLDQDKVWCQELSAASEAVLIDEFVGEGKTMTAMAKIAKASEVKVIAQCCLLDLSPSEAVGHRHSLYSWQADRTQPSTPRQRAGEGVREAT